MIKAWFDSFLANSIIRLYVDEEMDHGWKPWFGEVSSHSNLADDPSRLVVDHLLQAKVERRNFSWGEVLTRFISGAHSGDMG